MEMSMKPDVSGPGSASALPGGEAMSEVDVVELRKTVGQKAVSMATGLSPISCWRGERAGTFPKSFRLTPGGRAKGWFLDEIQAWQRARDESRKAG
jgi:predicted DNA-binding transcriptional regulator AlpA